MTDKIIPDSDASSEISEISEMERPEPCERVQTNAKRKAELDLQLSPGDPNNHPSTKDSRAMTETSQSAASSSSKAAVDAPAEVPEVAEPKSKEELYEEAKARKMVSRHLHPFGESDLHGDKC
ncbi:MAG TPA: hypothetical protein VHP31_11795 [Caproicibacter sp.]|nr:hypothetical protein [Caproicibacter sp.]